MDDLKEEEALAKKAYQDACQLSKAEMTSAEYLKAQVTLKECHEKWLKLRKEFLGA